MHFFVKKASVLAHVTLEGLAVLRTAEDTDKQLSLLTRVSATQKNRLPESLNIYPSGIRDPISCIEQSITCFPALAEIGQTSFFWSSV